MPEAKPSGTPGPGGPVKPDEEVAKGPTSQPGPTKDNKEQETRDADTEQ